MGCSLNLKSTSVTYFNKPNSTIAQGKPQSPTSPYSTTLVPQKGTHKPMHSPTLLPHKKPLVPQKATPAGLHSYRRPQAPQPLYIDKYR
jgi:hypothetical protein